MYRSTACQNHAHLYEMSRPAIFIFSHSQCVLAQLHFQHICKTTLALERTKRAAQTMPAYLLSQFVLLLQLLAQLLLLLLPLLIWQESSVSGGVLPNACQLCSTGSGFGFG